MRTKTYRDFALKHEGHLLKTVVLGLVEGEKHVNPHASTERSKDEVGLPLDVLEAERADHTQVTPSRTLDGREAYLGGTK